MGFRRHHLVAMLAATVVLAAGVGIAVGQVGGGDEPPANVEQTLPPDPSLAEIAAAASAAPGEVLPPCPTPENVDRLKAAGIDFGPCDPLPEEGQQVVEPDWSQLRAEEEEETGYCYRESISADLGPGQPGGFDIVLPCVAGPGDVPQFVEELEKQVANLPPAIREVIGDDVSSQALSGLPADLAAQARQLFNGSESVPPRPEGGR
jgi:hypothetical protein